MPLFLATVRSAPQNQRLIQRFDRISPNLGREARKILNKAIDETTDFALKGFKSSVAVDTFELRGKSLDDGLIYRTKLNSFSLSSSVLVSDQTHYGRLRKAKPASTLAEILNTGSYKRSQSSAAIDRFQSIPKGSPTAGWIGKAERQITSGLKSFLSFRDFSV